MRPGLTPFSSSEHVPLLVNVLRVIRNGRSPDYRDHEHGPALFIFASLHMHDSGPYHQAEKVWTESASAHAAQAEHHRASAAHTQYMSSNTHCNHFKNSSSSNNTNSSYISHHEDDVVESPHGACFAGPLYLTVYIDGAMVERWTVEDFREQHTENTIPHSCDQLESLNSLVRIVYSYLRMQEIYTEVVQRCTSSVSDTGSQTDLDHVESRARRDGVSVGLQLVVSSDASGRYRCAADDAQQQGGGDEDWLQTNAVRYWTAHSSMPLRACCREEMWAVGDLVRVKVLSNALWRSHMRIHSPRTRVTAREANVPVAPAGPKRRGDCHAHADGESVKKPVAATVAARATEKDVQVRSPVVLPCSEDSMRALHTFSLLTPPLMPTSWRSDSQKLASVPLSPCCAKAENTTQGPFEPVLPAPQRSERRSVLPVALSAAALADHSTKMERAVDAVVEAHLPSIITLDSAPLLLPAHTTRGVATSDGADVVPLCNSGASVQQMHRIFDPRDEVRSCDAKEAIDEGAEAAAESRWTTKGLSYFEIGSMAVEPLDNSLADPFAPTATASASLSLSMTDTDAHNDDIYAILGLCDEATLTECTPRRADELLHSILSSTD